jgi:hypothetical protein
MLARILQCNLQAVWSGAMKVRFAYGVVWLDEGVVDGDDLDIVVLDAGSALARSLNCSSR